MQTIAMRFSDKFAPEIGTIEAHQHVIEKKGFVWYGKFGSVPRKSVIENLIKSDDSRILLIHSGKNQRYWAKITDYTLETPLKDEMPGYYSTILERMHVWFKVSEFKKAPKDVMSKCIVTSSQSILSIASKESMSPFFIIETQE
ncbi:hypothetical protein [Butyrivibrio fibrisolvens]|uniref:hypothetical protein n=1 Tax=Butyrivibrio fibrisolvens TaxID=831 RepID=UPI0003B5A265|nr:hypothetical protein [Butyrivibrio fibrisolvens]